MQVNFIVKFVDGKIFEGKTRNWNAEMEEEIKRIFSEEAGTMWLHHTQGLLCLNLSNVLAIDFQVKG